MTLKMWIQVTDRIVIHAIASVLQMKIYKENDTEKEEQEQEESRSIATKLWVHTMTCPQWSFLMCDSYLRPAKDLEEFLSVLSV